MSDKPKSSSSEGAAPVPKDPARAVYGDRWGRGPASPPHDRPGATAGDPAPEPRRVADPGAADPGSDLPVSDEDASKARREQRWESEGGAASPPAGRDRPPE